MLLEMVSSPSKAWWFCLIFVEAFGEALRRREGLGLPEGGKLRPQVLLSGRSEHSGSIRRTLNVQVVA